MYYTPLTNPPGGLIFEGDIIYMWRHYDDVDNDLLPALIVVMFLLFEANACV